MDGRLVECRPVTAALVLVVWLSSFAAPAATSEANWSAVDEAGAERIYLYFFWTRTCPHCQRARPFVEALPRELPWLELRSYNLTDDPNAGREYARLAQSIGERAQSVPAFLFCGRLITGYDDAEGVGARLRRLLQECKDAPDKAAPPAAATASAESAAYLPGLGEVDLGAWSLPLVAITLGLLDSVNPCAFFVLLFLLSLLVNARSRARILAIGGLFIAVSGAVYFIFMAAWLNLFLVLGQIEWMTLIAGVLAIVIGVLNVKDFVRPGAGPSLSIPERARPGLFQRMRQLVGAESLPTMILATLLLAVFANAYELLCTAGLPMVFTRILTLEALPVPAYYGYLVLYCAAYVVPLLAIVATFGLTLGRHKLTDREGRLLKLLSGLMMLGLGVLLAFRPAWLNHIGVTLALIGLAMLGTFLCSRYWPEDSAP
jgi:thiol-disulfide isomerase/thioredoxin